MRVPRTAADVLGQHVTLEIESIDRRYLNLYVPQLQCAVAYTLAQRRVLRAGMAQLADATVPGELRRPSVCRKDDRFAARSCLAA